MLICVLTALVGLQAEPYKDVSPHVQEYVESNGANIHLLDWGGNGQPLLLLHGVGSCAHEYDDVAPGLSGQYHVVGMTRRGHLPSQLIDSGYDLDTLSNDIAKVIEAKKLGPTWLIGHSWAAYEITRLAKLRPDLVAGVILLDPVFGASQRSRITAAAEMPTLPSPSDDDLASYEALRNFLVKNYGGWSPAAENCMRVSYIKDLQGKLRFIGSTDPLLKMSAAVKGRDPEYADVKCKAAYIFAEPTAEEQFPFAKADATQFDFAVKRNAAEQAERRAMANELKEKKWTVIGLPHTTHGMLTQSAQLVVKKILSFLDEAVVLN